MDLPPIGGEGTERPGLTCRGHDGCPATTAIIGRVQDPRRRASTSSGSWAFSAPRRTASASLCALPLRQVNDAGSAGHVQGPPAGGGSASPGTASRNNCKRSRLRLHTISPVRSQAAQVPASRLSSGRLGRRSTPSPCGLPTCNSGWFLGLGRGSGRASGSGLDKPVYEASHGSFRASGP